MIFALKAYFLSFNNFNLRAGENYLPCLNSGSTMDNLSLCRVTSRQYFPVCYSSLSRWSWLFILLVTCRFTMEKYRKHIGSFLISSNQRVTEFTLVFTNLILIQRDVVGYKSSFMIKSHELKRNIFILFLKFFSS